LADGLISEFDLSEYAVYRAIGDACNKLQYKKSIFAINDDLKMLIKRKEELELTRDLMGTERSTMEKQISQLKREELKINKLFSNFTWEIRPKESLGDSITIDVVDDRFSNDLQKRLDDFFGSWGGSECIYMFEDGREISCYHNRDDGDIHIYIRLDEISSKELLEAFSVLGIKISFDGIQEFIDEKKEQFKQYEAFVSEFKI
jgi:hypothetical protein